MNVSIGKNLEKYIEWQLKNGPFNSASEIVRDALRMHQIKYSALHKQSEKNEDLEKWKQELQESEESKNKKSGKSA